MLARSGIRRATGTFLSPERKIEAKFCKKNSAPPFLKILCDVYVTEIYYYFIRRYEKEYRYKIGGKYYEKKIFILSFNLCAYL